MLKVVPLALLAGAAAFVSTSNLRDARSDAAFKVPVVTVHASEFAFAAPKSIIAGQTTVRLVNDGKMIHQISILKLEQGKTMKDLAAVMKDPNAAPPAWLVAVGGPNAAAPGATIEATIDLAPGNYVLLCFIPSPGDPTPHTSKGMVAPLTVNAAGGVTQAGATFAPAPDPDVHLVVKDYGFTFSKPITAGKHTIHMMNNGPQDHEVVIVKLAPGKHVADFNKWLSDNMKGPPPATPMAGMAGMAKGRTGIFSNDFTPGTYAMLCFVPAPDKKSHAEHGMSTEFVVK
ncbi:MAG: hypothetical protein ACJ79A_18830 [Gemmatimonadaceae bacterium]